MSLSHRTMSRSTTRHLKRRDRPKFCGLGQRIRQSGMPNIFQRLTPGAVPLSLTFHTAAGHSSVHREKLCSRLDLVLAARKGITSFGHIFSLVFESQFLPVWHTKRSYLKLWTFSEIEHRDLCIATIERSLMEGEHLSNGFTMHPTSV